MLISIVLLMIVLLMSFEYGNMQHQLDSLQKQLDDVKAKENIAKHFAGQIRADVNAVRKDETELKKETKRIEKELKQEQHDLKKLGHLTSWGEDNVHDRQHHVHMKPLKPHHNQKTGLTGVLKDMVKKLKPLHGKHH